MIVKNKKGSKTNRKEKVDDYCLRCTLARLPSASSVARRLLLLLAMLLGFALIGKRRFEVGKDLRTRRLVKSWGHLRFLFIGPAKPIVASGRGLRSWPISQETLKVERFP
jgi:hypothetical protein